MSRRLLGSLAVSLVAVLLAGCGAGGFGSGNKTEPLTDIRNYVALGDGFAAGPYLGTSTDPDCLRSAANYPAQVAEALGVTTLSDQTCTGASTASLTARFKAPATKKELPAQLDAVTADTDLVTIGIGLSDNNLINDLFRVCSELPCGNRVSPKAIITQLELYEDELTAAVRSIQETAPASYIVMVGYPQIMPPTDGCPQLPRMTAEQLNAAYVVLFGVNEAIRSAARQSGAAFVDAAGLSASHTVCSEEPWVTGKGAKEGEAEPFHPLAVEQKAVADAITAQVDSR